MRHAYTYAVATASLALVAGCATASRPAAPPTTRVPAALHASSAAPGAGATAPSATDPAAPSAPSATDPAAGGLLTAADVRPDFATVGDTFDQPFVSNPFADCGPDGLPGPAPTHALSEAFLNVGEWPFLMGGESVLAYPPGGAAAAIEALSRAARGTCHGQLRSLPAGPGALLLESTDSAFAATQQAHAQILYYAIQSRGDRLAWVTVLAPTSKAGQLATASRVLRLAVRRMCAATTC